MPDTGRDAWGEDTPDDHALRPVWADDPETGPDELLRPAWEDQPDETLADPSPLPRPPRPAPGRMPGHEAADLLAPLAAAQDALARLDARAEAAGPDIRAGLIARLALREAAGYLAANHAWVHPHDLALRELGLAGRFDTAVQTGRAKQAMPNTLAARRAIWDEPDDLAAAAAGEQAVFRALALARLLRALPRRHDPLLGPTPPPLFWALSARTGWIRHASPPGGMPT